MRTFAFVVGLLVAGLVVSSTPSQEKKDTKKDTKKEAKKDEKKDEDRVKFEVTDPKKGEKVKVTVVRVTTTKLPPVPPAKDKGAEKKETVELEYSEELVATGERTTINRTYERAEITKDNDRAKPLLPTKQTVIIDKAPKNNAFTFTTNDGKALEGEGAKLLHNEFNDKNDDLRDYVLPIKPVKIDETWTLNQTALLNVLGSEGYQLDAKAAYFKGQRVQPKEARTAAGKPLAKFDVEIGVPVLFVRDDTINITPRKGALNIGKLTVRMTGEGAIDEVPKRPPVEVTNMTLESTFDVSGVSNGTDVTILVKVSETRTIERLKK